ncbi:NOL1/NOP2/sun family protein [Actinidia rufa]|uniref:NOL1/NOP2/sun family protein n=1 Tax=Actinidia rufa TaxID=165716 RepID=A0A7J0DYF5_9ERIC|nr:NOL1/NOP2/sun family protein [Actinidia rufa]
MAQVLSIRVINSADIYKASEPSKFTKKNRGPNSATSTRGKGPVSPAHRTQKLNLEVSPHRAGPVSPAQRTEKLNLEVSPHRAVSAVRLMRIEFGGAFADLLNEKGKGSGDNEMGYVERTLGFRTRALDDRDLRLVTDIVGGTIRWRRYLDHLILSLCRDESTFGSMEPLLLQILRIGFYEIVKLDMPPYAVVDENVRLAKVALRPGAGNMVNGILRKLLLLKGNNSLPLPKLEGNDRAQARALATLYSHPVIVIQSGLLKEGLCSVQDESAGLVVSVVDPQPGESIIDCCAAPGGKTLFMASRLSGRGVVSAIDVNKGRLRILREAAKLQQVVDVITTVHADLRRADLRWNKRLEDMEQLKNLQDELLDAASMLVKPGGVLVYSTCSIDPEENEERVTAFLLRHPEFRIDPVDRYVPSTFVTEKGFYSSNPVKHSIDGAFAARLVLSL